MITRCIVITVITGIFGMFLLITLKANAKKDKGWRTQLVIFLLMVFACSALGAVFSWCGYSLRSRGLEYEAAGNYAMALDTYQEAWNVSGCAFTDLEECVERVYYPARYAEATELYKQKDYTSALIIFLELGDYGNSKTCVENCMRAYLESR